MMDSMSFVRIQMETIFSYSVTCFFISFKVSLVRKEVVILMFRPRAFHFVRPGWGAPSASKAITIFPTFLTKRLSGVVFPSESLTGLNHCDDEKRACRNSWLHISQPLGFIYSKKSTFTPLGAAHTGCLFSLRSWGEWFVVGHCTRHLPTGVKSLVIKGPCAMDTLPSFSGRKEVTT